MKTSTRTSSSTNGPAPEPALDGEAQPIPKGLTLSGYIRERFEEFSRSQKDVARYIVDHLEEAAFQTAEELARRANTSSSTVVRFSQALGFEGFPELQEAAREEYRHPHRRPPRGLEPAAAAPGRAVRAAPRVRGLPGAAGGRARGVPPPPPAPAARARAGGAALLARH